MNSYVDPKEYRRIVTEELKLRPGNKFHQSFFSSSFVKPAIDIRAAVGQIREVALNSTVLRSYIKTYGLDTSARTEVSAKNPDGTDTARPLAYESDGAHANLLCELLDQALIATYGPDFGDPEGTHPHTVDGYTYREVMRAARIHDLGENITGDNPDNGSMNESVKFDFESEQIIHYLGRAPEYDNKISRKILKLLTEMEEKSSPTGRLLYVCDKFAANVIVLTYDSLDCPPMLSYSSPRPLSDRDKEEMELCDFVDDSGRRLASEMWAADMLHIRTLVQSDDTGFITACLVMYTLLVHGHWYSWREADYKTGIATARSAS